VQPWFAAVSFVFAAKNLSPAFAEFNADGARLKGRNLLQRKFLSCIQMSERGRFSNLRFAKLNLFWRLKFNDTSLSQMWMGMGDQRPTGPKRILPSLQRGFAGLFKLRELRFALGASMS
jgi:hypothetical protein